MLAAISYPPIPIFELGPLSLSLHGLFAGIGFVVGAILMLRELRRRGYDTEKATSVLMWALVASLLGARFFTVPAHIGSPGYGLSDALSISGDYSILGGYAGGIIGALIRMRMLKMPALPLLDAAAPGLALGAVVGRIGDLAIVEHLGSATTFFLGFAVRPGYDLAPQHNSLECTVEEAVDGICGIYHHSALYDMIGALVLLGVLLWLRKSWTGRHYGQLFAVWAIWYGLQRFVVDFTRLEAARNGTVSDSVMGPLTGSQWGALIVAAIGLGLFVWWRRQPVVSQAQDIAYGARPPGVEIPDDSASSEEGSPDDGDGSIVEGAATDEVASTDEVVSRDDGEVTDDDLTDDVAVTADDEV